MHHTRRAAQPFTALAMACATACGMVAAPAALAGNLTFDVQLLPASPGMDQGANSINASGVVVGGESRLRGLGTAFKFEGGVYTLLPKPAMDSSTASGISDSGLIVGRVGAPGRDQAVFFGTTVTPIAGLPLGAGESTYANGIDPDGRSVIGRTIYNGTARSWINSSGALTEIPLMSNPVAINSAGQVAGNLSVAHRTKAALYGGGVTRELGTLGGVASWVTGLNASGTVVGGSDLAGPGTAGFVFENGSLRATTAAAGSDSFLPAAINDAGQMMGTGVNRSSNVSVAQWAANTSATPVAINDFLSASATETLLLGYALNASGQIAGLCTNNRACLLTPTGTLAWASTTGGSFEDAQHWDSGLGFAPNQHLDVLIAPAATVTVRASQNTELKSLVVGTATQGASQATLQLSQGARLVGSAATTRIERSGVLQGDGVIAGGLVNRGTVQGTATTPLHITVQGTLDNQGLITGSGRINANLINRGSSPGVRVGAGEVLTIAGSAHSGADGSVIEVRQGGELRLEGLYTAQAGSFIRLDNATVRVSGLLNASTVQIGFGGASIFGDINNSQGSHNGRIIASGGSEVTFWNRVANHNEIRAAAGSHIVYFGDVSGPGSFTTQGDGAYHRFEAGYAPGTGTAQVELGAVQFASVVDMDLGGSQAGAGHDQIRFDSSVLYDSGAQLSLQLLGGFSPTQGDRFQLFSYSQGPLGQFGALHLPSLAPGLAWDTQDLYAGGWIGVTAVPEPATWCLALAGIGVLLRRRLSQTTLALACGLSPAAAWSQGPAADAQAPAFADAMQHYERNHWPQAFAALQALADQGHPEAQRVALLMWRHGTALYGTTFNASSAQRSQWALGQRAVPGGR